ncbi:MAG: Uma2 family endonuclease [Cyanobacteria bacterium J06638_6]
MTLTLPATLRVTPDQFWQICQANPNEVLELSAGGEIEAMSPTGWQSGKRNADITFSLRNWVRQAGQGAAFDSSTGFRLPNGAVRSPDAAWISSEKLATVDPSAPDQFFPGCPDFVIELASASDDLTQLRAKMAEYIDNGAELGWLIVPRLRQTEIYTPGQAVVVLNGAPQITAPELLPGFVLETTDIF